MILTVGNYGIKDIYVQNNNTSKFTSLLVSKHINVDKIVCGDPSSRDTFCIIYGYMKIVFQDEKSAQDVFLSITSLYA